MHPCALKQCIQLLLTSLSRGSEEDICCKAVYQTAKSGRARCHVTLVNFCYRVFFFPFSSCWVGGTEREIC